MRTLAELDRCLGQDASPQRWDDVDVLRAVGLVSQLTETEFDALAQQWRKRPVSWSLRLADVLADGESRTVIPILLDMIVNGDDDLAVVAADSLRAHIESSATPLHVSPDVVQRLTLLREGRDRLLQNSLTGLVSLLKTKQP